MSYLEEIVYKLIDQNVSDETTLRRVVSDVYSRNKVSGYHSNVTLRSTYDEMVEKEDILPNETVEKLLVTKKMRSLSGVSIITVLTKPYLCPGECIYCPTEKDVPKSYLSNEPAVMRAILNHYDAAKQVKTRLESLKLQGHPVDKVELIVIGGTFSFLPKDYQEEFIKNCFEALNGSSATDLTAAKRTNETAKSRCVGLTLETRPDFIDVEEIKWFRYLGATRVELGVQIPDNEILKLNKRGHGVKAVVTATKLLKDAGFKICWHLMPNLYGSDVERDIKAFRLVFTRGSFCPDYIKIYPCMVTGGTPLETLFQAGKYSSYSDQELIKIIIDIKKHTPYWARIMRTIRDIPATSIVSGSVTSNLRQVIMSRSKAEGWQCHCIRCREVGFGQKAGQKAVKLFQEEYQASGGREIFLSYETTDRILFSLLRLRLTKNQTLSEIKECALIREVHTYGQEMALGISSQAQHAGYGKKLISQAEAIALSAGFKKIAVIAGVGVRDYYRKLGYNLIGEYMVKDLC